MRNLWKKTIAAALACSMAITGIICLTGNNKTVAFAEEAATEYHAYTSFQIGNIWTYRDSWASSKQGLDGGNGPGNDYTLTLSKKKKGTYNYLKQYIVSDGVDGTYFFDGGIKDAAISQNGTYVLEMNDLSVFPKIPKINEDATKWNELYINTDIPAAETSVKCTNVKVYFDDETTPFAEIADAPINKESTNLGVANFYIFDTYKDTHKTTGVLDCEDAKYKRFPTKNMKIEFTISGLNFSEPKKNVVVDKGLAESATFTDGDFRYKILTRSKSDGTPGTVAITGLSTAAAAKTSITTTTTATNASNKYTVEAIAAKAFQGNQNITNITLSSSIRTIGNNAFNNCTKLNSIATNQVTSIGSSAFENCKNLTKIGIGNNVKTIGSSAFKNCTKIKNVTYNQKISSIASSTFEGCIGLKKVVLGKKVKTIKKSAFKGCKKLAKISVGRKVKVSKSAFKGCKKMIKISGKKSYKNYAVKQIKKSGYKKVK